MAGNIGVAEEYRFRDLDLKPAGGQSRRLEGLAYRLDYVAAPELHRRHVDGYAGFARPHAALQARFVEDELADLDDQAHLLRDRNEFGRRDHAALRVMPAQQCLAGGNALA